MNLHTLQSNQAQNSEHRVSHKKNVQEPFWGRDGFTFGDVLDMVNPLHHIPIVSRFYQQHSNDEVCEGAKLVGGVLLGGLVGGINGVLTSLANSAVRNETRQGIVEHLVEMRDEQPLEHDINEFDQFAWLKENSNEPPSQRLIREKDNNPFFSQLFEEEYIGSDNESSLANNTQTRIRNWGKV